MPHRRSFVILAWFVGLLAAALAGPATAQDRIPQDAIVAQTAFNDTQRQAITAYVSRWAGVLNEATTNEQVFDTQVSDARQKLLSPIRTPGATDFFKKRYSVAVSEAIAPLLDADRLIVRLNVMIVVTKLTDDGAIALAEKGIKDPSPSVRYWAAKATISIAETVDSQGNPILDVKGRLAMLRALEEVGTTEESTEVLQQVMLAMSAMNVPSAIDRVLDLLDARLKWHVDRPYEPYLAESAGLRAVYQTLLRAPAPNPAQIRKLAHVSHRYMNLISRNLADAADKAQTEGIENPINRELEMDHAAMLELAEYALQYVHSEIGSQESMPISIIQKIPFRNWKEINLIAVDGWGKVLKAPPLSFTPGDLAIVQK